MPEQWLPRFRVSSPTTIFFNFGPATVKTGVANNEKIVTTGIGLSVLFIWILDMGTCTGKNIAVSEAKYS